MLLILPFGILLTYAVMTADFPYRDAALYAIDQALGLDRRAYLDLGLAYSAICAQARHHDQRRADCGEAY